MNQELVKSVVRVGNSAGVLLPREWLNGKARVVLVEKPLDIESDSFEILKPYLRDIIGIYIVGSYARNEQTSDSDVDMLVITHSTNKHIRSSRYDILLISEKIMEEKLKKEAFPILSMLIEARPVLNKELAKKYSRVELTEKNLGYYLETTKSALKLAEEDVKASIELRQEVGDASAYSLILRLRTLYIIECIKNKKMWKKREFLNLISKTAGSLKAYKGYLRVKNNKKIEYRLPVSEAEKLIVLVNNKLKGVEEWLKGKKG